MDSFLVSHFCDKCALVYQIIYPRALVIHFPTPKTNPFSDTEISPAFFEKKPDFLIRVAPRGSALARRFAARRLLFASAEMRQEIARGRPRALARRSRSRELPRALSKCCSHRHSSCSVQKNRSFRDGPERAILYWALSYLCIYIDIYI